MNQSTNWDTLIHLLTQQDNTITRPPAGPGRMLYLDLEIIIQ